MQMLLFYMEKMKQVYFLWHLSVSLLSQSQELMAGDMRQGICYISSIKLSNMSNMRSCVKTAFLGKQ